MEPTKFTTTLTAFIQTMPDEAKEFQGAESLAHFAFSVGYRSAMEHIGQMRSEIDLTRPNWISDVDHQISELFKSVEAALAVSAETNG